MPLSIPDYLKEQFHISLQEQQKEALDAVSGPVLLLAVPGAGKTTVMVARIAHMIANCGIPPEQILTITFSRASAADMENRYQRLFGPLGWATPQFSTIHSFCYKVLRSYVRLSGGQLPELLEGSADYNRSAILRDIYRSICKEFLTEDVEEELLSQFSLIKNGMLKAEEVRQLNSDIRNLWELYEAWSAYKRQHNLMDFDDMLGYAYTALRKQPRLLESYRSRYPYLCVDEAQDTSKLQHEIIRLIAAPRNNLFMVGDEDQSIYRFRGAHPQALLDFPQIYPGARILKMEENFRSSGAIVERAAVFIKQNRNRYEKNMFTQAPKGQPIETPELRDMMDQYQLVVDTVKKSSGSVAVIYRNNFSAIPLVDLLSRQNMDFYIRDQKSSFRKNAVVSDILDFLRLSFDPTDLQAFSRVFYRGTFLKRSLIYEMDSSPLRAGESWFDRLQEQLDRDSGQRERQANGSATKIAALVAGLRSMKPLRAINCILNSIGYLNFLEFAYSSGYSRELQKLAALKQLATRVATVAELMERLEELDGIISEHSSNKDCPLTLTTAHSTKGLEFDTVILIDASDEVFPEHKAISPSPDALEESRDLLEEEARLFYVACTRARNRLIIPKADYAGDEPVIPSRFISRLVEDPLPVKGAVGQGLYPGLRLLHPSFGEGQVMSIDRVKGTFHCFFKSSGSRTLAIDYAKNLTFLK